MKRNEMEQNTREKKQHHRGNEEKGATGKKICDAIFFFSTGEKRFSLRVSWLLGQSCIRATVFYERERSTRGIFKSVL